MSRYNCLSELGIIRVILCMKLCDNKALCTLKQWLIASFVLIMVYMLVFHDVHFCQIRQFWRFVSTTWCFMCQLFDEVNTI